MVCTYLVMYILLGGDESNEDEQQVVASSSSSQKIGKWLRWLSFSPTRLNTGFTSNIIYFINVKHTLFSKLRAGHEPFLVLGIV